MVILNIITIGRIHNEGNKSETLGHGYSKLCFFMLLLKSFIKKQEAIINTIENIMQKIQNHFQKNPSFSP